MNKMKKYITTLILGTMLAIMVPIMATTTIAQTRTVRTRSHHAVYYKRPNYYRRHRKLVNIGGGAAGGAVIGALIGGRKGAVIGGVAGAGTGAVVTHKQRPKNHVRRYYRRVRNY